MSRTISEADVAIFADVTGDTNPLHVDEDFAKRARFGGRIAHGMLTASLISAVLGTKLPGPGSIYLNQSLKFLKPVRIGDTVRVMVEVISFTPKNGIITLKTRCTNQDGDEVLCGEAVLLVEEVAI